MRRGRRRAAVLAALLMAGTAVLSGAVPAASAATKAVTACPTGWGSLPKSVTYNSHYSLTNIRTGRQDCYDRIVFDVPGAGSTEVGYNAKYVDAFYADGSGNPIPVSGGAILEIYVGAPSYNPNTGGVTYPATSGKLLPGVNLTGYETFRDAKYGASFEGTTQIGLGVRARLPFRVFQLPDRVVVDVAHSW